MNDAFFVRLERTAVLIVVGLAGAALVYRPGEPRLALGVVGGGALVALSYWAIRGAVEGLVGRATHGGKARKTRRWALVKFFTRHAILALAGYVMMARLGWHPLGMLLGVTAPAIALAITALAGRPVRRP